MSIVQMIDVLLSNYPYLLIWFGIATDCFVMHNNRILANGKVQRLHILKHCNVNLIAYKIHVFEMGPVFMVHPVVIIIYVNYTTFVSK